MNYYKYDDMVIMLDRAPLLLKEDTKVLVTENGRKSLNQDDTTPWPEASEMEYRLYMAELHDYISTAPRDDQASMWAINKGSDHILRIGGNWPEDDLSVEYMRSKEAKINIVKRTQHWYRSDKPKINAGNAAWTAWIKRTRAKEPFIYLG